MAAHMSVVPQGGTGEAVVPLKIIITAKIVTPTISIRIRIVRRRIVRRKITTMNNNFVFN